jgi:hypothetical protein
VWRICQALVLKILKSVVRFCPGASKVFLHKAPTRESAFLFAQAAELVHKTSTRYLPARAGGSLAWTHLV